MQTFQGFGNAEETIHLVIPAEAGIQSRGLARIDSFEFESKLSQRSRHFFTNFCLCHYLLLIEVLLEAGKDLANILWFAQVSHGIRNRIPILQA